MISFLFFQIAKDVLLLEKGIKEATDSPRIYVYKFDESISYREGFSKVGLIQPIILLYSKNSLFMKR
jgi:hypothetical protein